MGRRWWAPAHTRRIHFGWEEVNAKDFYSGKHYLNRDGWLLLDLHSPWRHEP